jgi:hypothetical protein
VKISVQAFLDVNRAECCRLGADPTLPWSTNPATETTKRRLRGVTRGDAIGVGRCCNLKEHLASRAKQAVSRSRAMRWLYDAELSAGLLPRPSLQRLRSRRRRCIVAARHPRATKRPRVMPRNCQPACNYTPQQSDHANPTVAVSPIHVNCSAAGRSLRPVNKRLVSIRV